MQTLSFTQNSNIILPLLLALPKQYELLSILCDAGGSMMMAHRSCAEPLFDQLTDMVSITRVDHINILIFDDQPIFCNQYTKQEFIDSTEDAHFYGGSGNGDISQAFAFLNHPVPYCPPSAAEGSRPLYRRTDKSPIILITDEWWNSDHADEKLESFGDELIVLEIS